MVVGEPSIHNIMGGMESTGGVRLHNHKRKLKQRFDIIKKLGQGTYGKVQLGINKETGQEVAIKTIKKCKIETEADLIRIRREIQIMSSVQHPNIIHIYEVFENREKMVLVMEYAAGGELYDYLSERKVLSEEEARRIFRQITIAVFYCHKHKICHRDLKLENILLDQTGNAKIADFGLSNVFDDRRLLNTFCGSPLYASPEIVKGTPYHGPEVDCWSLGVLLYTLVYGAMPFDGSNFKRLTRQISASDYFEPKIPSAASPLIKEMLTKCPSRRADIEKICSHWWVNQDYDQNCLDIAENLAAQTPVRLDLLLSLVPQSASADKLVVGDPQTSEITQNMSTESVAPTRCHSVGSLMELDRNNSEKIREMIEEEEPKATNSTIVETKRKLETTPSMEETVAAGSKKKDKTRKKEKSDERDPRAYVTNSRHHSAPIANTIKEEQMDIDLRNHESNELDLIKDALVLQFIKEEEERSKERSKTPVVPDQIEVSKDNSDNKIDKEAKEDVVIGPLSPVTSHNPLELETPKTCPKKVQKTKKSSPKKFQVSEVKVDSSPVESESTSITAETEKVEKKSDQLEEQTKQLEKNSNKIDQKSAIFKKSRQKAVSIDSEEISSVPPTKPVERRRSKIFETAEKFNQLAASTEIEKPKKIFIPGVNVGGAKRVFERKASLGAIVSSPPIKQSASKVIIDVPKDKTIENVDEKSQNLIKNNTTKIENDKKKEEEKKRAVDIITGALGKPPVLKKLNGSPPLTPQSSDSKKLGLKIQLAPNDVRNATISVTTPTETKYPDLENPLGKPLAIGSSVPTSPEVQQRPASPKMSSKMEITLKSATLPRRKTSKAEITLAGYKPNTSGSFKSEVEAKINAFQPSKLRTQKSEVAFPVVGVIQQQPNRSASLGPENSPKSIGRERIIPIQVEGNSQEASNQFSIPPSKPPMPQRSMSQKSESLSRQSTADSDTDSALGSAAGPEPIRKSPREYIIPISVEGGGYVTPRSGSLEPESKNSTPTSINAPRSRFGRPKRIGSLLSDASEDESPFSTLHRDSDDLLHRHMHRLRSSRPTRQAPEHADSLSSGEDDEDDDGFELLTAENLFSTLLSRVRSLTQRLNVDDTRGSGFPSSRLLGRMGSNSSQGFWGLHEPISRRMPESPFRRPLSRDASDRLGRKDSAMSSTPGTPSSLGSRSERNPSRESIFDVGSSNTLPRDEQREERESLSTIEPGINGIQLGISLSPSRDDLTPCLARRLSRQFIEQTRQSLPRSPSIPRERLHRSSTEEPSSIIEKPPEYRSRSSDRSNSFDIRRTHSLLDPSTIDKFEQYDKYDSRPARKSICLFDDDDDEQTLPPLPRQVMTLGRKYRDPIKNPMNGLRRDNSLRADKIQEESSFIDDSNLIKKYNDNFDNNEINKKSMSSITDSQSMNNSTTNLGDVTPSLSIKSFDTSPTESTSNLQTDSMNSLKADAKEFECRLLAAENLIKESKLRNLGIQRLDQGLMTTSNYKDTDNKCDKELLGSISDLTLSSLSKRRSCIPSLRLRSESLNRDVGWSSNDRRRTLACSNDTISSSKNSSPERSLLSKLFRSSSSTRESDSKEKSPKAKRRISRFLRPDFFDTPREESQYVKEKEAQKAAENERRKTRFMRRKCEKNLDKDNIIVNENLKKDDKPEKELKNKVNAMTRDKVDVSVKDRLSENNCENKIDEDITLKNSLSQNLDKTFDKSINVEEIVNVKSEEEEKQKKTQEDTKIVDIVQNIPIELEQPKTIPTLQNSVSNEASISSTKSKVSSVLGLFKNDSKSIVNGTKPATTLLSKFKKNTYKGSRSDTSVQTSDSSSSSKIPTKSKIEIKNELKGSKKIFETKRSTEKMIEIKKSPTKEKTKEKTPPMPINSERKSSSVEKQQNKLSKKLSPEKSIDTTKIGKIENLDSKDYRKSTPEKSDNKNSFVSRLSPKKSSPEKIFDNKKLETKVKDDNEEKKTTLKKKYVKSLTSLGRNSSLSKLEKDEDKEKKLKKIVKKDSDEKEENGDVKKKKLIKVVKKVVKKSNSYSDSKSEDKVKDCQKSGKIFTKKPLLFSKKEHSPEVAGVKEKSPTILTDIKEQIPSLSISSSNCHENGTKENSQLSQKSSSKIPDPQDHLKDSENSRVRANRSNLKLDLSKIQQYSFKNPIEKNLTSPKSESILLLENSKAKITNEDLSKMTHHANITGNKIIIDKPLRTKDYLELNQEDKSSSKSLDSCEEISISTKSPKLTLNSFDIDEKLSDKQDDIMDQKIITIETNNLISNNNNNTEINDIENEKTNMTTIVMRQKLTPDETEDILSPMEDNESFDSWSICSNDLNHRPGSDLQSPTSPGYSPLSRNDHPESIIDRIRRKSFYSRFNERKRKSSLNPSTSSRSTTSTTLPRKYSFNNSNINKDIGDIKRINKPIINSYSLNSSPTGRNTDKQLSMYTDELTPYRRSPIDRERYSDIGCNLSSPTDSYGTSTSCYDSLRRYRVSPIPGTSHRNKYSSNSDFTYDPSSDHANYKNSIASNVGLSRDSSNCKIDNHRSSTLPRKYGTHNSSSERKTADYYEELLSPSRLDYLTMKKTIPVASDCTEKYENCYHNGNNDSVLINSDKWKNHMDKYSNHDSPDESDKSQGDDLRCSSQTVSESKELSAACPDSDDMTTIE